MLSNARIKYHQQTTKYKKIHQNTQLTFSQKNVLKLRALVFPVGLWWASRGNRKD